MNDSKQFAGSSNLEQNYTTMTAAPASSTRQPNINTSSESSTVRSTSAPPGPIQPFRPRVTPVPSLSSIPQSPVSSSTMNMESLSLVNPLGPSTTYQMPAGFVKSDDMKRGQKARRKRTTPAQLAELLKVFEFNENPSHDVREMLSKKVAMTNREVQVWFQNRRAKEANTEKKHEQSEKKPDSPPTDIHDQAMEGPNRGTTRKIQPIQAAPYPPAYSYTSSGANQFSAFRRMSLGITPDGRTVFFPQPTFTVPSGSSPNVQQFGPQPQPMQFMPPQAATGFLPTTGNRMQAFPGAPQMMLVPVFASPQGFLPPSASGYAYAPAPPTDSDSATRGNVVAEGSRRGSLNHWQDSGTDLQTAESRITEKMESVAPRTGAEALNALASAASEQSLADSS